jgi:hypothetical protein
MRRKTENTPSKQGGRVELLTIRIRRVPTLMPPDERTSFYLNGQPYDLRFRTECEVETPPSGWMKSPLGDEWYRLVPKPPVNGYLTITVASHG